MFVNVSEKELMKAANPKTFSSSDSFFDNYYGENRGNDLKKSFIFDGAPASAGDTSLAGTAHGNYRNYLYGRQLWAQMNLRSTAFTAVPRNQYVKSGFRIIKDFATPAVVPNSIAEGYSHVPDIKVPDIQSLRIDPRVIINNPYGMTLAQMQLDGIDDTVNFDAILEVLQNEFSMRVNGQMLMMNYNSGAYDPSSLDPDIQKLVNYGYFVKNVATLPDPMGMPIAPLDNLVSGYTEYTTLSYSADPVKGAGAVDLFNIDRHSAASNMDSYVSCSTSTRNVSVDILDDAIQQIMPFWKDNTMDSKVILTGFDTIGRMQQLHYQFQRFMSYQNHQVSYNGVKTCPGDIIGFGASQFKGIPIVPDFMTTKAMDGSGVSKIYVLDTNTIQHAILIPPTFIQDKSYLARRSLTDISTYYMSSQEVCTKPRANAKIMNLV